MHTIAILGAGDLAATLARRLAEGERARRIVLVDSDEGRARGKALDIAQAAPVEGFDTRVEGAPDLASVGAFETLVVADVADLAEAGEAERPGDRLLESLLAAARSSLLLAAGPSPSALIEAAVAGGLPRDRVLGSSPVAQTAALRRQLAAELGVEPREVSATVMGLPPHDLLAPQGSAMVGGVPVEKLSAVALRRALAAITARRPGPASLAAAAARVLQALAGSRPSVLPVVVRLDGEYGHRGAALAVPARLAGGRLDSVLELALEPVDRVAFDNAAQRRLARRG